MLESILKESGIPTTYNLKKGGDWEEELLNDIIWSFKYEELSINSTRFIYFIYDKKTQEYKICGKRKPDGQKEPDIITLNLEEAYKIVQKRINEIPDEPEFLNSKN